MTSKLTRERLAEIAQFGFSSAITPANDFEIKELARLALAAMNGEPVAEVCEDYAIRYISNGPAPKEGLRPGDKLYRHAQPAPVVPDDVLAALQKVARIRLDMDGFDGDRRGIADCLCDAEEALIEVVNRRAAMLNGGKP
ncbi:TPA: hypothetical protein MJE31_25950 [Klebsiella pneumoniae]|jgi:hypothetical protein|uniref:hypothetical protein n=1 Tax=Klebsiella pneumoniae TaxID=573 RepID=UPI001CC020AB|nr:hypothetical protein [Klebsiella pneumoniae]ELH4123419.1 hypothetical protein [Klebsiella pneumoniae]MBZ1813695.1 hypothetical protein [Klebsiella pneumoniae]MDY0157320.1 hypothetical protein [Klebsiella pneumoniae]HBZ0931308.1 hypothetical protein [Klebsiella pneumoniae]